jgi:hypothetical protein
MSGLNQSDDLHGKDIILLGNEAGPAIGGIPSNTDQNNLANKNEVIDDEGNISSHIDTLDESVYDTLKRDFVRMVHKLEHVLIPRTTANNTKQLRNCNYSLFYLRGSLGTFTSLHHPCHDCLNRRQ